MNRFVVSIIGVALLSLAACSHHETKTTVENTPATVTNDQDYLTRADREINDLQSRLDRLKNVSASSWRKYHSGKGNLRTFLNAEYSKLGQAREELRALRNGNGDAATHRAGIDRNLAGVRTDLDGLGRLAE